MIAQNLIQVKKCLSPLNMNECLLFERKLYVTKVIIMYLPDLPQ